MSKVVRVVLAYTAAAVCGACGTSTEDVARLDVETYANPDNAYDAALYDGALTGSVGDGQACFWLATTAGDGAYVKWPEGHYALDNPLRVLSPDGAIVAESGTMIQLGGGERSDVGECGGASYNRVWRAAPVT